MARPLRSIIETIVSRDLSPAARQAAIARFARGRLAEAQTQNRQAAGRDVPFEQFVDGRAGAALETVDPDRGVIVFRFDVVSNLMFAWIAEQLVMHAPRLTGRYADSFRLYAGGREIEPAADLPKADEYVFLNVQPYSAKIERGLSAQAPAGVFQAVAAMAKQRYGDVATIRFTYIATPDQARGPRPGRSRRGAREQRAPAIVVRPR